MKEDKNKLIEERLGHILSESVRRDKTGYDGCLSADDIATLLEGGVDGQERDRMMGHIASCDTCLETFQLSAGLMEDETGSQTSYRQFEVSAGLLEEKTKKRGLVSYFKPMALAASVVIVAIGMYLFFNSAFIPKNADQHDAFMDKKTAASETITASEPEADAQSSGQTTVPVYQKTTRPSPSKPVSKGKIQQKKARKTDARGKREKRKDIPDDGLRLTPAPAEEKTNAVAQDKRQIIKEEAGELRRTESAAAAPITMKEGSVTGLQRLNMRTQRQTGYLAAADLRNLFSQALQLKSDLSQSLTQKQSKKQRMAKTLSYKQPGVVARYKPLVQVVRQGGRDMVLPDVSYLLSRSQPGTLEYKFFNLAQSGWCTPDGLCMQGPNLVTSFAGKIDKKTLLSRWETIYPSLTGTFRQIAEATIERIKRSES